MYSICQRYRFQSKLQPPPLWGGWCSNCIQYVKDTDFKANYNRSFGVDVYHRLYSICQRYRFQSKLQPVIASCIHRVNCIQYVKDTDFKANYNLKERNSLSITIVFNMSKIQISKQITTKEPDTDCYSYCIQYVKDTDFKANYNQTDKIFGHI